MRKLLLVVLIAVSGLSLIIMACSDDTGTNGNLTEGDYHDPNFMQARELTEGIVDSMFINMDMAFGYIDFDGMGPARVTADTMTIVFDETTCWWEIYAYMDSTGFSMTFIDSVRFQDASGCQQYPDSATTTEIEYRAYAEISASDQQGSLEVSGYEHMLLTGIQSDTVVINASSAAELNFIYDLSTMYLSYDGVVDDVAFLNAHLQNYTYVHPLSGFLSMTMTIISASPEGSVNATWGISITFFEDHYHARAESGDNYWEWDHYYEVVAG